MYQKRLEFLFFLFIVSAAIVLPWSPMLSSGLIGISAFFWLLNLRCNKSAFLEKKNLVAFFLLAGYYLINIVGFLNTDNFDEGFFRLESKLLLLVCPLIVIFNNAIDQKRFSILLSCFSFSVVASVLYCFVVVVHGNLAADIYPLSNQYFYYTYTYLAAPLEMHPTYFSAIVSLAIFYFVLTFKSNRVLASICLPVLLVFNVLLFSRGALTGFMAGLAFMALFISSSKQKIIAIGSIVVFASVIAVVLQDRLKIMLHRNKEVLQRNVEVRDSYLYHVRSWYCAAEAIGQSNLLMGYGTGDEMDVLNACYRSNGWDAMKGLKAHNEYLSEMIRHGIPGLLLLLSLLIFPLYVSVKNKDVLTGAFIAMFIFIFLAESLSLQPGVTLLGLFNSLNVRNVLSRPADTW